LLDFRDNLGLTVSSLRAYKLRSLLTMLGLSMGVATVITVMTLIEGANLYVETKIADLGTNVFQISRVPLVITDFSAVLKALRNKKLFIDDAKYLEEHCLHCSHVGARASYSTVTANGSRELPDTNVIGHTPNMADIDTRKVIQGRYFTPQEDQRASPVCIIGSKLVEELFVGVNPLGKTLRAAGRDFIVVGVFESIGSVLGMDQDNFMVIPMGLYLKIRGRSTSVVINAQASSAGAAFEQAQDEARLAMRARRQILPGQDEDFFIGTASSYIDLWKSFSQAFFAVFMMVSTISAVVGGIVIMNVMLVSVTERKKEIGIRRAVGATQADIRRQFMGETIVQCVIGGLIGILFGFLAALAVREFGSFPASVETNVAAFGFALSTGIGMFFGIYPATRAAKLDPVVALRSD
jgi:putative ABC transport system permease protein